MIVLDTNVVVRLLIEADDPDQTRRARKLLESSKVLLLPTVLLETEWVLRGAYGVDRATIGAALRRVSGLPDVVVAEAAAVEHALSLYDAGSDFADALHLALAGEADEGFATFDKQLAKRAHPRANKVTVL